MKKAARRNAMRIVRRVTGLSLPDAAKAAKALLDGNLYDLPSEMVEYSGGCECCGRWPVGVEGPKGSISREEAERPAPKRESKPMPDKVRTIRVKVRNADAALFALRKAGVAAMIANGVCLKRAGRDGADMVEIAINVSGNQAHKILVEARVTAPVREVMKP